MKQSIEHFSHNTQRELNTLVELIRDHISDCRMIILFGSYAREEYVLLEEHCSGLYQSDYDLLVVTDSMDTDRAEHLLRKEVKEQYVALFGKETRPTPFECIVTDIDHLNRQLETSQYFETHLIDEGILLYDTQKGTLAKTKKLSYREIKELATDYYDFFFNSARKLDEAGMVKTDASILNQACQQLYKTILAVFTLRQPDERDLTKLGNMVKRHSKELSFVFPKTTEFEIRCFNLLNSANERQTMGQKEFDYIADRTQALKELTECICKDRITYYGICTD